MATNNNKTANGTPVNIVDLLIYLLRYWYWFVLCIGVAVGYAYYKYSKTPFTYRSDATVIIKSQANTPTTTNLGQYSNMINRVNLSNEIMTFRSKSLMTEVVKAMDLDVSYIEHIGLRDIELYNRTPVRLLFSRGENALENASITVTPKDEQTIMLDIPGEKAQPVHPGDTITLGSAKVVFQPTGYYNSYLGKSIDIIKTPAASAAAAYVSRLRVSQIDRENAVLAISEQDFSLQRAKDILTTLVDQYNLAAVREKELLAHNTAEFINERINIIEAELGEVEQSLASYKRSARVVNFGDAANSYLAQSNQDQAAIGRAPVALTGMSVPEPIYLCVTGEALTLTAADRSIVENIFDLEAGAFRACRFLDFSDFSAVYLNHDACICIFYSCSTGNA